MMHLTTVALMALAFITSSLASIPYQVQKPSLGAIWTYSVGTNPWLEYPRPRLERATWTSLNGIWTYQNAFSLEASSELLIGQELEREAMVPSCLESGLSDNYYFLALFALSNTEPVLTHINRDTRK